MRVYQKLRIPLRLLPTCLLVWASKGEGQCSPRKPAEQATPGSHQQVDCTVGLISMAMNILRASKFWTPYKSRWQRGEQASLTALMRAHNWEPIRIKRNSVDGGGVTERIRGYRRKTNKLPHPKVSQDFPGKVDISTPYVIGKVVSRLEADSRWALARSVRALVAERDTLRGKLDGNFNSATGSGAA